MAFRSIIIENPAHISCRNSQLIIRTDSDHTIAVEVISALLIESRQSTVTAAALSLLGQSGCAGICRTTAQYACSWSRSGSMSRSRSCWAAFRRRMTLPSASSSRFSDTGMPAKAMLRVKEINERSSLFIEKTGSFGSRLYHTKNCQGTTT